MSEATGGMTAGSSTGRALANIPTTGASLKRESLLGAPANAAPDDPHNLLTLATRNGVELSILTRVYERGQGKRAIEGETPRARVRRFLQEAGTGVDADLWPSTTVLSDDISKGLDALELGAAPAPARRREGPGSDLKRFADELIDQTTREADELAKSLEDSLRDLEVIGGPMTPVSLSGKAITARQAPTHGQLANILSGTRARSSVPPPPPRIGRTITHRVDAQTGEVVLKALCEKYGLPDDLNLGLEGTVDFIEKGKSVPVGTVTTLRDGRKTMKTERGWRIIYEGKEDSAKREAKARIETNFTHNGKGVHVHHDKATGRVHVRREDGSDYKGTSKAKSEIIAAWKTHPETLKQWTGDTFVEYQQGMSELEYANEVAGASTNPLEVAVEWLSQPDGELGYKDQFLRDHLTTFHASDWKRFGDWTHMKENAGMRLKYIQKNTGTSVPLDVQCMEFSEMAGVTITEEDVIDFVLRHPKGPKTAKPVSEIKGHLERRFRELTGIDLEADVAHALSRVPQIASETSDEDYAELNHILNTAALEYEECPF